MKRFIQFIFCLPTFMMYSQQVDIKSLLKQAEAGLVIAQGSLAIEYYTGENVAKSYEKAFYWAQKAALQEEVNAQNLLGLFYEEGVGTTQSYEKAFEWYLKA
ncbi:Sel1 repeat protein, partial [Capnocytophaga sp. oral taxon 332 str. F0381]|uniref:tetratricopeptide repeat protein n=1 Tax=Capnocytophaga sp. oral taxon 332 TaxID=712213 RepID=UPI0002A2EF27